MLKRSSAAAYLDMSEKAFEREVANGRLPQPIILGGRNHWCRNAIDKALDQLTGADPVPEYRRELEARYARKKK
ncbi:MAG: hypothetical protein WA842_05015 [Croceibacterium sp.]